MEHGLADPVRARRRRLLVTGAGGQLGRALVEAFGGDDVIGLSRAEWDAYQRSGAASGGASSSSRGASSSSGAGKTGTTAGPGETSPRTAPGSATATQPDTSGTGKAQ